MCPSRPNIVVKEMEVTDSGYQKTVPIQYLKPSMCAQLN